MVFRTFGIGGRIFQPVIEGKYIVLIYSTEQIPNVYIFADAKVREQWPCFSLIYPLMPQTEEHIIGQR